MKQKLTLLIFALFTTVGAWATDVTVIDKTKDATTYGSLSNGTFTTNSASGMAGVTIDGIKSTTATNFAYGACLGFTSVQNGTVTMTAPTGYIITGYTLTARSNTYSVSYTLTPSAGGSAVTTSTGGVNLTASGLNAQTASFTYSAASANSFYIPSMTITVVSETANLIDVTYELYESDGTTLVNSVVKEQEENSAVEVPSSLTAATYYDYTTEGTIGTSDCTIKVIRTLKSGYVISLDGFSNSKCYNIRNNRGTWAVGSGATVVNSTVELNLAFLASDAKQQFAFITYEGNVYLYSVGEGKFAYVDGTKLSLTADVTLAVAESPVTFQESTSSFKTSEPIIVTVGGKMYGVSTGKTPDVFQYDNHPEDGGNCAYIIEAGSFDSTAPLAALEEYFHPSYTITYVVRDPSNNVLFTSEPEATTNGATITTLPAEYQRSAFYTYNTVDVTISASGNTNVEFTATPKADAPVKFTADTSNPYYYNLSIRSKYLVYNSGATGEVTLQEESEPFNADASWAFIGNPYAFKLINKTKGTSDFLTYTSVVVPRHANNNIQFVSSVNFVDQYWTIDTNTSGIVFRMKANTSIYFHHDSGNNFLRTCSVTEWSAVHNDAGSTIVASTDEDVLIALYNELNSVTFADGVGNYHCTSGTAEDASATITSAGTALANHQTSSYSTLYASLLEIKANIALNTPAAGFYRIQGNTSGKYLAAGLASNNKFAMTDATDATTVFYYDGTKLTNLSSGMCNGVNASDWAWVVGESASEVTFHDGHTSCGYGIQTATAYFYDNGDNSSSADRGTGVDMSSGDKRYRSWSLTEITTLPIRMNEVDNKYYGTINLPVAVTIPEGVYAYKAAVAGDVMTLTKVVENGVLAANTPVVLYSASEVTSLAISAEAGTGADGDAFSGTTAAINAPEGTNYVLSYSPTEGVGFYKYTVTVIPGFKAYFNDPSGSSVKGFSFSMEDVETAIRAIESENNDLEIYDIAGRRVQQAQKGLYIVNGKKVMFK